MLKIEQIRLKLRKKDPILSGKDGETFARLWLEKEQWGAVSVDQAIGSKSDELINAKAKRPDFVCMSSEYIIWLDAKYHSTSNLTQFAMSIAELRQYSCMKALSTAWYPSLKSDIFFMLFPKEEDGKRLVFVDLEEFYDRGVPYSFPDGPGLAIDIVERLKDQVLSVPVDP